MKRQWLIVTMMGAAAVAMAQAPATGSAAPAAPAVPPGAAARFQGAPGGGPEAAMMRERGRRMMGADSEGMMVRMLMSDQRMIKELGLTDEQVKAIKDAMAASEEELKAFNEKIEKSVLQQAELMKADTLDEAALMKAVEATGELRTQIAKLRMKQVLAGYKVLLPAQRTKLSELVKQRIEQMRERWANAPGRGGRGGAGPGGQGGGETATPPVAPPPPPPVAQ